MAKIPLNSHTWIVQLVDYTSGQRVVKDYCKCTTWNGAEWTMRDYLLLVVDPESGFYGCSVEIKTLEPKKYVYVRRG